MLELRINKILVWVAVIRRDPTLLSIRLFTPIEMEGLEILSVGVIRWSFHIAFMNASIYPEKTPRFRFVPLVGARSVRKHPDTPRG